MISWARRVISNPHRCRSVASFGDLDLDYLASIHELEAADDHMLGFDGECGSSLHSGTAIKRVDVLARTRSEAALPSAKKGNPLSALGPDAGLQCILDFLASDSLRCAHLPTCDHLLAIPHLSKACCRQSLIKQGLFLEEGRLSHECVMHSNPPDFIYYILLLL